MDFLLLCPLLLLITANNGQMRILNSLVVQQYFYNFNEIALLAIANSVGGFVANRLFNRIINQFHISKIFLLSSLVFLEVSIIQIHIYQFKYMIILYVINGFLMTLILLCSYYIIKSVNIEEKYFGYIRNLSLIIALYIVIYYSSKFIKILIHIVIYGCIALMIFDNKKKLLNSAMINNQHTTSIRSIFFNNTHFFIYYVVFFLHEIILNNYFMSIFQTIGFSQDQTLKCFLLMQIGKNVFSKLIPFKLLQYSMSVFSIITIVILYSWTFFINKYYLINYTNSISNYTILYILSFLLGIIIQMRDGITQYGEYKFSIKLTQPKIIDFFCIVSILSLILGPISMKLHNIFGISYLIIGIHVILIILNIFLYYRQYFNKM